MKYGIIVALVACGLLLCGCKFVKIKDGGIHSSDGGSPVAGNGTVAEKSFDVNDFSAIKLNVPADVVYEMSGSPSMLVRLDENLMDLLKVSVEDGVLVIGSDTPLKRVKKLQIILSSSSLQELKCYGAVDFETKGSVRGERFTLLVSGAADVDMDDLDVKEAVFQINGAGDLDIHLSGAERVDLGINGAGDAKLSGRSEAVAVSVSGAGDVDLSRLDYGRLDKNVSGMGSVKESRKRTL
ncbi:MAG: DUF2807 domain-containing protein [Bacteroidales bacterium]|nr:DUF2807 domain-containing protein [Bacteroidales bacterium]